MLKDRNCGEVIEHCFFTWLEDEDYILKSSVRRIVYFDARTKLRLQNYLNSRTDENAALFVNILESYNQLEIAGVEK